MELPMVSFVQSYRKSTQKRWDGQMRSIFAVVGSVFL